MKLWGKFQTQIFVKRMTLSRKILTQCLRYGSATMAVLTNKTVDLTDADIDAARVKGSRHKESLAVDAGYEAGRDAVFIVMDNGIRLEVPRGLLQGLENATPEQLAQVQV